MRTIACGDCVVSFLLTDSTPSAHLTQPAQLTTVAGEQVVAISILADKGLVPPLRYTS
jgi:uncharacterized protein YegL